MVPQANKTFDSEATPPAKTHKQCPSTLQPEKCHPLGSQLCLMACLLSRNPSRVEEFHSNSRHNPQLIAEGTQKQYWLYLEKWQSFADRRAVDPLYPPVKDALEFLQGLYDRGLGYSCLNTARSALSSFTVLDGNVTLGNHPLVQRFLKGVFQTTSASLIILLPGHFNNAYVP